jgi:DNA repair ATPase RecN
MKIDRIEIRGGFLDGLDLAFSDGLNVLIGARGAGKTSVLELLRFALGVRAMTSDAEEAAHKQARAVLGDGTVSVFCSVQDQPLIFSRTGLDEAPALSGAYSYQPPLIVSQNEIEAIGLDPRSRREIVDRLIDPLDWASVAMEDTQAEIASLERRLERLREEKERLFDQAAQLQMLADRLAETEREQAVAAQAVEELKPLQQAVADQADALGQIRAAADAYKIAHETLGAWKEGITRSRLDKPLPQLHSAAVEAEINAAISQAGEHLSRAAEAVDSAQKLAARSQTEARAEQQRLQEQLKADAERLDAVQRGAGDVGRRVSALRQQLREQEGYAARARQLEAEIAAVAAERDAALDETERRSQGRYELRRTLAASVTEQFHGRIEIRVSKSGELNAYEAALVNALQGSNLQYKSLATSVAEKMSPREFVACIEQGDPERIASTAQISMDRAIRVVGNMQGQSAVDLLLAPLEDAVDFALLDGTDYKATRELSMGQRCTVILPLLLVEDRPATLLDQPEDHLDNAFIVDTLVEAIRERASTGQVIVATHNANIPVLGEASRVVVLASDGRRGYVSTSAKLDDDASVNAISTLMEGGREAFARRAAFYTSHDDGA